MQTTQTIQIIRLVRKQKPLPPTQPESADTNTGGPGAVKERGWVKDDNGWYYVKGNGIKAVGRMDHR
mgnify:CR=1 FL=1